MLPFRAVYIAFDPHPSFKGASTHIHQVVDTLASIYGPVLLLTLRSNEPPIRQTAIHQLVFESEEPNLLLRATAFARWAEQQIAQHPGIVVAHYRDIWGGTAALRFPHLHTLFEVNGLPSIELPARYTQIAPETLDKIRRLEDACLRQSKRLITPSYTTQRYLIGRGIPEAKITVIPNGADIPRPQEPAEDLPFSYMAYVGALQPWQGVDILFKSLRYIEDLDLPLVLCCSYAESATKAYHKFAAKLGVEDKIIWRYQLSKGALQQILQHALFSVAPLTECSRNIEQGCSPLKILESMACATPVIASQLPAVEELITHDADGILVKPGRPAELGRAIRLAVDYPGHTEMLGAKAQEKVRQQFTWERAHTDLRQCYDTILTFSF